MSHRRFTNGKRKGRRNEGGYVLAVLMILIFAIGIAGMSYFSMAGYETKRTQQDLVTERSFWLAEAGLQRAYNYVSTHVIVSLGTTHIYTGVAGPDGGTYSVDYVTAAGQQPKLVSVGTYGGHNRSVSYAAHRMSLAEFAYFTDDETDPGGATVWFLGTDAVGGPAQTNGTFHIRGNPSFSGPVWSVSDRMIGYSAFVVQDVSGWPVGGNSPTFARGFDLNQAAIVLPTQTTPLRAFAQGGGVDGIFNASGCDVEIGKSGAGAGVVAPGWLRYRNSPPPANAPWTSVEMAPLNNHIFYSNNDIHISGVMDGVFTFVSKKNIQIVDDLTYQGSDANGRPLPNCDDMIGLIAENDIVIPSMAATDNIKINAVMLAEGSSINAVSYNNGVLRGDMTVWGGLIQYRRGNVGLQDGSGNVLSGYRKDYHYDPRVWGNPPPYFPMTNRMSTFGWQERASGN